MATQHNSIIPYWPMALNEWARAGALQIQALVSASLHCAFGVKADSTAREWRLAPALCASEWWLQSDSSHKSHNSAINLIMRSARRESRVRASRVSRIVRVHSYLRVMYEYEYVFVTTYNASLLALLFILVLYLCSFSQ